MLVKFFVVLATFTLVTEAKRLTCTKPGDKSDSGLETYDVIPGKKGATGSKGIKGEQYLSEEMMDNLESKKMFKYYNWSLRPMILLFVRMNSCSVCKFVV